MPAGVDGFVPERLRIARCARALLQKELAQLVDRADGTISKWESDDYEQKPDAVAVSRLAEVLQVDVSWFFKPFNKPLGAAFFRSLKSELGKMREKAEAKLSFVETIDEYLSIYVDLPPVDVPDFVQGRDFRTFRTEDIEHFATSLRDHWGLGDEPIEDLLLLIENAGIVVAQDEIGSEKLDGISRWSDNGRPYILLAKDKYVGVRRRFDAAHELGHIVLHRYVSPLQLAENFTLIEEQAMIFAGALLMPREAFGDDIYSLSLDVLSSIKEKWKVAIAAMIKRLSNIERISPDYERRLWQYYNYRRWRGNEPLDDKLPIEQPQNLKTSIEMIINEGSVSKAEFLRDVGLKAMDIASLTGISEEYLLPSAPNVVRLQPSIRRFAQPSDGTANVINLSDRKID